MALTTSNSDTAPIPPANPQISDSTGETVLPVPFLSQAPYHNLCWAACCAMVDRALATKYPGQFGQLPAFVLSVSQVVIQANRCDTDPQAGIDQTCWPDCACSVLGFPCTAWNSPVSPPFLCAELTQGRRPVGMFIDWGDGSSHVVLVVGVNSAGGLFAVNDPLSGGIQTCSYDQLISWNGVGRWTKTYFRFGYSL
jgi:hypothetical protein